MSIVAERPTSVWRYGAWFVAGLIFAATAWAVCGALGDASTSVSVDFVVGLIAGAFAFSLFTGVSLGLPGFIRDLGSDNGRMVSGSGGLKLALFAVAVAFVGPFVTALLQ